MQRGTTPDRSEHCSFQSAGGRKERGHPLLHRGGRETERFGVARELFLNPADKREVHLVPGPLGDDRTHQRLAEQVEIPQEVQILIPTSNDGKRKGINE